MGGLVTAMLALVFAVTKAQAALTFGPLAAAALAAASTAGWTLAAGIVRSDGRPCDGHAGPGLRCDEGPGGPDLRPPCCGCPRGRQHRRLDPCRGDRPI